MPFPTNQTLVWIILTTLAINNIRSQNLSNRIGPVQSRSFISISNGMNYGTIDRDYINSILESPESSFSTYLFDRESKIINVDLELTDIIKSKTGTTLFYNGVIVDKHSSLVTLTVKKDQLSGILSDELGNYNFSTSTTGKLFIVDHKFKNQRLWSCNSALSNETNDKPGVSSFKNQTTQSDTIEIYFECDYELFVLHNFSSELLTQYIQDLFHQVKTLYDREGIILQLGEIKIWEIPDPYDSNSTAASLVSFRSILGNNHPGTLAHLLSGNANLEGGTAFINGLCDRSKSFGYSNVEGYVNGIGVYSWDVHVVAHELGHNLGSQHTHDCAWGADGTEAIDACGEPDPECDGAPIPIEGGTIMSYCHTTNVGVNFSLGFGEEPAERMRGIIDLCQAGVAESCATAITIFENGTYFTDDIISGNGATHNQSTHSKWYKYEASQNGKISLNSCNQNVDTRLFVYQGDCNQLEEIANSDDDCLSGNGFNYASSIIDLTINSGTVIYFEWDDRWSNEAFNFTFTFISDVSNSCNNGILDGNETGIDCGGDCTPCMLECNDQDPLPQIIETERVFNSQELVQYDGRVNQEGSLTITTKIGGNLNSNFEIASGAQFEIAIGNCN